MNKRGQALVEFVLILPVFLFLMFAIYDIGNIFNKKNALENDSADIVSLYTSGSTVDDINTIYSNLDITFSTEDKYTIITINRNVKLMTPGFNRLFGNPYKITVRRYIPNE